VYGAGEGNWKGRLRFFFLCSSCLEEHRVEWKKSRYAKELSCGCVYIEWNRMMDKIQLNLDLSGLCDAEWCLILH
jgi:hypothetical protein